MPHEPLTGMFALLNTTLAVPLVSVMFPPLQVVEGAGAANSVRPLGTDSVMPDCVNANPLPLASVTVSAELASTGTLSGENVSVTVGAATDTVMGATQAVALLPPEGGAEVMAPFARKLTVTVSVLPAESVTTNVKVPVPVDMRCTVEPACETTDTLPPAVKGTEPTSAPKPPPFPGGSTVPLPVL